MDPINPLDPQFPTVGPALTLAGILTATYFAIKAMEDRNRDHREKTLIAIENAVRETDIYEMSRAIDVRDPVKERQLASLWNSAAMHVRHYSRGIADRMVLKEGYWLDPDNWTDQEIASARIGLVMINDEARRRVRFGARRDVS